MNRLRIIFLLGVLIAVLIGIGGDLGRGYLYGFTALALIINFGSYVFSDRIVLAMHRAKELGPDQAPALHRDEEGGGSVLGSIILAVVASIGATLVQLGISRSREYLADETAARLTGEPCGLARALVEKLQLGAARIPSHAEPATASLFIVSPLAGRGSLLSLFSTHPPMEERIARLRGMTDRLAQTVVR